MTKWSILLSTAAIVAIATASPALAQAAPSPAQGSESDGQMHDIVGTAQRTSQRLQGVPIAVSARNSEFPASTWPDDHHHPERSNKPGDIGAKE